MDKKKVTVTLSVEFELDVWIPAAAAARSICDELPRALRGHAPKIDLVKVLDIKVVED